MNFCALRVGAVIVNAVAPDLQNNIASLDKFIKHNAEWIWGNAQVTGACPCASARAHANGLREFTHQPPPWRTSKTVEIWLRYS